MPYTRTNWRTEETPLSAGNFNNIEDGVEEALNVTRNLQQNFASLALDIFYPVGSYYETSKSTAEFNPGTAWGGTWELETSGLVHIGAGTGYTLGATGGNKDAIVPYHRHSIPALSGSATGGTCTISSSGGHSHTYSQPGYVTFEESGSGTAHWAISNYQNLTTTGTGNHTHTVPNHTHPVTTTASNTGYEGTNGNATNANMQPYIVVNRWHRTA